MKPKSVKPVVEIDDAEGPTPQPGSKVFASVPTSPATWLIRLGMLAGLLAIAVWGFGSAAGWFEPQPVAADPSLVDSLPATTASTAPGVSEPVTPPALPPTPAAENLPPLGAIVPATSEALLSECKLIANHLAESLPGSLEAREMLARYEYQFGDLEIARKIWLEMLEVNPNYAYALRGLGDVCTVNGELKDAVRYFRRAVLVAPESLTRQVTLGVALVQAAQLQEAQQVFEGVLARDPKHAGAHAELGSVQLQLQNYEAARDHFLAAIENEQTLNDPAKVHFGLATAYQRLGDKMNAAAQRAEHKRLQAEVGEVRKSGRREYDDIAAIRIDVARLYVDMARVYLSAGGVQAAELLLLRASQMDLQDSDSRQALAFISVNQGKVYEAIRWLGEVAELQPDEFSYRQEMARLYVELNRVADAERELTNFAEEHPDSVPAMLSLAQFYVEVDSNPEKAAEYAVASTELQPSAANFAFLSSVYQTTGQTAEAVKALQEAVRLEPKNPTYAQALALLQDDSSDPQP